MLLAHVHSVLIKPRELLLTNVTLEPLLLRVHEQMLVQIVLHHKRPSTNVALEPTHPGVLRHVVEEADLVRKPLSTKFTRERFLAGVDAHVPVPVGVVWGAKVTMRAAEKVVGV